MKIKLLFLILIMFTCTVMGQKNKQNKLKNVVEKVDSIHKENVLLHTKINSYSKILDDVISENKEIIDSNRNLELKVAKLEAEKGYYKSGLQGYTAIFAVIVTIIVIIMGYFNWRKLKDSIDALELKTESEISKYSRRLFNKLKAQDTKVEEKLWKIDNLEVDIILNSGDLNATIGFNLYEQKLISSSLKFFLTAAHYKIEYCLIEQINITEDEKDANFYHALKQTDNCLNKLLKNDDVGDNESEHFLRDFEINIENLNELNIVKFPESALLVSEIRIKLYKLRDKFTNEIEVTE